MSGSYRCIALSAPALDVGNGGSRVLAIAGAGVPDSRETDSPARGSDPAKPGSVFVVKLRNALTRSWGDQVEVVAASAHEAAERIAGEPLLGGVGERSNLRARVWPTPFGSMPDIPFYVDLSAQPVR